MKLTLAFSPCPNDTYIFDAIVHQKVDTEGLEFEYFMADVEKLNGDAFAEKPDVTKLSFHAYLHLAGRYLLLDSGAALGFGAGPLVVSKQLLHFDELKGKTVAIPGIHTTARRGTQKGTFVFGY
jgi:1,4-dihydroxy-6-naphthoate synthase